MTVFRRVMQLSPRVPPSAPHATSRLLSNDWRPIPQFPSCSSAASSDLILTAICIPLSARDIPSIPTAPRTSVGMNDDLELPGVYPTHSCSHGDCGGRAGRRDARNSQPGLGPVSLPPSGFAISVTTLWPSGPLISQARPFCQTAFADTLFVAADGRSRKSRCARSRASRMFRLDIAILPSLPAGDRHDAIGSGRQIP